MSERWIYVGDKILNHCMEQSSQTTRLYAEKEYINRVFDYFITKLSIHTICTCKI